MRLLCLLFTRLPIQLARRDGGLPPGPLVAISGEGDDAVVAAASAEASAAGVRPGMLAASARSRLPGAVLVPARPGQSLRVLEQVAYMVRKRATPRVAIGAIDRLFVDLEGLDSRFVSEEQAAAAIASLARGWTGLDVRAGVAGTRTRASETARLARRGPLVAEGVPGEPVERIASWRDETLVAGAALPAPGEVSAARGRLKRLLTHVQLLLDGRGQGFRAAYLQVETLEGCETNRVVSDDPLYSVAELFRRAPAWGNDELLSRAVALRLELSALAPDVRIEHAAAPIAPSAPAAVAPVRPIQRTLLRAG